MSVFTETFAPLRNRNLRTYLSGQAISLIGTWMQVTAQSWVVWKLSGSEAALGTVGMMATIPYLLLGPIAGPLADRWDRRRIIITTQAISMILAFILAALVWTDTVQLWHVYLLALTLGTVGALDLPAAQAFIGDMVGREMLRKAVVVNTMIVQSGRIIGPSLAGWVVDAFGAKLAFLFNGLSFIAVIASLLAVKATQTARAPSATGGGFREGLAFVRSQRRIQDLMMLTGLVTFFIFSVGQILPSFAERTLGGGADLYGTLLGASGAGALFGVIVLVPWAQRLRRTGLMLTTTLGIAGVLLVLFSFLQTTSLALALYFLAGICPPIILTTNNGLLQVLAPNEMRARLLSLYLMVSFGMQPFANLWVGWVAQAAGAPWSIRANGLALLLFAGLMLLRPGLATWIPAEAIPSARPAKAVTE